MGALVGHSITIRKTYYASSGKKYYEANKEEILKRSRRNYKKTRELKLVKHRHHVLKSRYGMTIEDYYKLLEKQNNKCSICKLEAIKTLDVDHDHKTGVVRGLLCEGCNTGLGKFQDNPDLLGKALLYLKI